MAAGVIKKVAYSKDGGLNPDLTPKGICGLAGIRNIQDTNIILSNK